MPRKQKKADSELNASQLKQRDRSRTWVFIVYPDSAPENWRDILHELRTPWAESPLHDADFNADETEKKAHWHVMMLYSCVKSLEQVQSDINGTNGTIPIVVKNKIGMARYFYHADNPEKAQYRMEDIKCHGGLTLDELLPLSATDKKAHRKRMLREMENFVDTHEIYAFSTLCRYARENNEEWYDAITENCAYYMTEYIKSAHWERNYTRQIWANMGEVKHQDQPYMDKCQGGDVNA